MRRAPFPNPFFRPEEKHVGSGENNVVPPLGRANKAMKKPRNLRPPSLLVTYKSSSRAALDDSPRGAAVREKDMLSSAREDLQGNRTPDG